MFIQSAVLDGQNICLCVLAGRFGSSLFDLSSLHLRKHSWLFFHYKAVSSVTIAWEHHAVELKHGPALGILDMLIGCALVPLSFSQT